MPRQPYRAPREWLPKKQRRQFGHMEHPDWKPATTNPERALLAAAQEQHKCAIAIRSNRDLSGLSTEDLAAAADLTLTTVRGYLNGSRHASLAVLTVLADAAHATLATTIDRRPGKPRPRKKARHRRASPSEGGTGAVRPPSGQERA